MSFMNRNIAFVTFVLVATSSFAQKARIISPAISSVTSPVRVVADFGSTVPITSISIFVDGVERMQPQPVTPLDIYIPIDEGSHLLTVTARQLDGLELSASRSVEVATATRTSGPDTMSTNATSSTSTSVSYSDIEERSGWYTYPDQGNPVCSSKPALVSSPSLDGISGRFYLGPTGQYNNCLWPIKLGSSSTATHFTLDTYYRLSNPAYAQGIEFSSNKHIGTKWYKFSVQCSYNKGVISVWDTAGGKWSATSIPCKRPALNSWDHLIVHSEISNGKAAFLSLQLNGVSYTINRSFYPVTKSSSYSYGVHFQMDGNQAGNAYYAWVDNLKFTLW